MSNQTLTMFLLAMYRSNYHILPANTDNLLTATVTGMRKMEIGLVIPAKFTTFTQELKNVKILNRKLNERASKYTQFELKNITIE